MKKKPTTEEIKTIASHLRKPIGDKGVEVANIMNDGNLPMNLHTLAVLNAKTDDNILEIGMANGYFVRHLLEGNNDIEYTGIDYSETMVNEAIKRNKKYIHSQKAKFIKADTQEIPFRNALFDKVFTINTFYFWDNIQTVLKEIKRVLKPHGEFVLAIRPKHNMEKIPVTKYNFTLLETSKIIEHIKEVGFNTIEKTEIKEPEQVRWGQTFQRESIILKCKINS